MKSEAVTNILATFALNIFQIKLLGKINKSSEFPAKLNRTNSHAELENLGKAKQSLPPPDEKLACAKAKAKIKRNNIISLPFPPLLLRPPLSQSPAIATQEISATAAGK